MSTAEKDAARSLDADASRANLEEARESFGESSTSPAVAMETQNESS